MGFGFVGVLGGYLWGKGAESRVWGGFGGFGEFGSRIFLGFGMWSGGAGPSCFWNFG